MSTIDNTEISLTLDAKNTPCISLGRFLANVGLLKKIITIRIIILFESRI